MKSLTLRSSVSITKRPSVRTCPVSLRKGPIYQPTGICGIGARSQGHFRLGN